ncbi:MAG: hypothetical protein ABL958_15110, partial [Bdellovibrionia bacterium]
MKKNLRPAVAIGILVIAFIALFVTSQQKRTKRPKTPSPATLSAEAGAPEAEAVEVHVDHRGGVERQQLAEDVS